MPSMHVIHHAMLPRIDDGQGACRRTVAGPGVCAAPFEVQTLAIEPGASAASAGAEALVVVAIAGSGKLVLESGPQRFHAPCTLIVPAGAPHRFVNNGATALHLVCVHAPAKREGTP